MSCRYVLINGFLKVGSDSKAQRKSGPDLANDDVSIRFLTTFFEIIHEFRRQKGEVNGHDDVLIGTRIVHG